MYCSVIACFNRPTKADTSVLTVDVALNIANDVRNRCSVNHALYVVYKCSCLVMCAFIDRLPVPWSTLQLTNMFTVM